MLTDVDSATYMDALMTYVQDADVQAAQINYLRRKTDVTQVGLTHTSV